MKNKIILTEKEIRNKFLDFFASIGHEIVPSSEEKRSLARLKWKAYKDLKCKIKSHKVV